MDPNVPAGAAKPSRSVSLASLARTASMAKRGFTNYALHRPFCISFEITRRCNAKCQHCHLTKPIPDEPRATPEQYGRIAREIRPVVAQVSGGEPLLRDDVVDVVRALARKNRAPYVVLTTNASLLTPERYRALREAGVREFSVSLDFPDERHDAFRGIPGLFDRIGRLVRALRATGDCAITFNSVIQRRNVGDLPRLAALATELGVGINFSAYTWLRTGDMQLALDAEHLPAFRDSISRLVAHRRAHGNVYASPYVLGRMCDFFLDRGVGGCRAGERFLVVNPDATMSPCGLVIRAYRSQREVVERFTRTNRCAECYTSLRANTEKPLRHLLADTIRPLLS